MPDDLEMETPTRGTCLESCRGTEDKLKGQGQLLPVDHNPEIRAQLEKKVLMS